MSSEALLRLLADDAEPRETTLSPQDVASALEHALANYSREYSFSFGQLIIQKDGLTTGERSGDRKKGRPAIFIRYEDTDHLYAPKEAGSPYTLAMQDCLVGWIAANGGMVISRSHSPIFEPWPAPDAGDGEDDADGHPPLPFVDDEEAGSIFLAD